jgi:uncharacterized protein (TIGR02118 family)
LIRVTVCYENGEGKTFDMDYYKTKHMEIVRNAFPDIAKIEIDQGLDGPYLAMGHLFFPSMETFQANMGGAGAADAAADVPNFTNVEPSIQVSQVVQ